MPCLHFRYGHEAPAAAAHFTVRHCDMHQRVAGFDSWRRRANAVDRRRGDGPAPSSRPFAAIKDRELRPFINPTFEHVTVGRPARTGGGQGTRRRPGNADTYGRASTWLPMAASCVGCDNIHVPRLAVQRATETVRVALLRRQPSPTIRSDAPSGRRTPSPSSEPVADSPPMYLPTAARSFSSSALSSGSRVEAIISSIVMCRYDS